MYITIVGSGKMSEALADACESQGVDFDFYTHERRITSFSIDKFLDVDSGSIVVHFGSGRELPEILELCHKHLVPLIQGSTKLEVPVEDLIPEDKPVTVINATNLSIHMARFMEELPTFVERVCSGMAIEIAESHQKDKKDVSGTARKIAEGLSLPENEIAYERKPAIQLKMGVPREHLSGHAYHFFTLTGFGVEIEITTKINGRDAYAHGAIEVAKLILDSKDPLQPRVYDLSELI